MKLTKNQEIVAEYYIASLGRSPDDDGLNYWANKLDSNEMSVTQVRDMFLDRSIPEVANRFPLGQDSLTTVSNIYQNVFGREGEKDGLQYWASRLDGSINNFEPLGENELISIMIDTAKAPENYLDGEYLQNKLDIVEENYKGSNSKEQNNQVNYSILNGSLLNNSNTDIIIEDFGFDANGTLSEDGESYIFDIKGSIEEGFDALINGVRESIAGFDFPDQIISKDESFYFNDFLPNKSYENIPGVNGQMNIEVMIITSVGTFTDETIAYL